MLKPRPKTHRPLISLIACIGKNRELGYKNNLIWKIPEDLAYFKEITKGHVVIMGQKTFESIGRPLLGRTNIVLSKDQAFRPSDVVVVKSMDKALSAAKEQEREEIFFIGGASVYKQAIEFADKLYLTLVDDTARADVFFPNYRKFSVIEKNGGGIYKEIKYEFLTCQRNEKK